MKQRFWWFGAVVICLATSALLARPGVVKTRDGKTLEGDIEEKPDQVIVSIRGIKTAIARDNVEGMVEYFDNVEARYKDKVSKLPKNPTAKDRLDLARWLYDAKSYDLAQQEIDEARKIDPNSVEAQTLEQTIMSQRKIERAKTGVAATPAAPGKTTAATDKPAMPGDRPKMLTAEDINIIRQMEWKDTDTVTPHVTVPADIRKKFVELKALNLAEFSALTAPQQAFSILRDGPPEMRKDIKVTTDPASMIEYRRAIQPLIVNNCATAGCHGGNHAGSFVLYNINTDREDVAYTNFYILQSYRSTLGAAAGGGGFGAAAEHLMIDRTYPDRSLLAQFSLHPDAAETDHPEIKGQVYKPISVNKNAPGYRAIIAWMKDLTAGEPNYGISYELPGVKKPAAPAPDKGEAPKAATVVKPPAAK